MVVVGVFTGNVEATLVVVVVVAVFTVNVAAASAIVVVDIVVDEVSTFF